MSDRICKECRSELISLHDKKSGLCDDCLEIDRKLEVKRAKTKKNIQCPYCDSDLKLSIGFTGCDWDTVAGEKSGYDWPISLECTNDACARIYPLVHAKGLQSVSVVKEKFRSFINYNL